MEIKNTNRPFSASHGNRLIVTVIGVTVVVTLAIVAIIGGLIFYQVAPQRAAKLTLIPQQLAGVVGEYVATIPAEIPAMQIDMGHLAFQEVAHMREEALKGYDYKEFSYVPAAISWKGASADVRLRLKGDRFIHFEDHHKWSFRVKVQHDTVLNGMRWFSLHRAGARNYIYEWLFHRLLKAEGFIALRYEFVQLYLNGTSLGVYAVEEHFDRLLVEDHQHREGPILKFDETLDGYVLSLSAVQPFDSAKWESPERIAMTERAVNLLEHYRQGNLATSEVFEFKKLATYFALADLMRMHHGQIWKSLRFYYNPVTSRLTPIGYDGHLDLHNDYPLMLAAEVGVRHDMPDFYNEYKPWFKLLFNDSLTFDRPFVQAYLDALDRISRPGYLEAFFEQIQPERDAQLAIIRQDFPAGDHINWYGPDFFRFSETPFFEQRAFIRNQLDTQRKAAHAYVYKEKDAWIMEVANLSWMPITLTHVILDSLSYPFADPPLIIPQSIPSGPPHTPVYQRVVLPLPEPFTRRMDTFPSLKVAVLQLGQASARQIAVFPWERLNPDLLADRVIRSFPSYAQVPFVQTDWESRQIHFLPGDWVLDKPLVIPKGFTVLAKEGVQIDLRNQAFILSYSPLHWTGTAERPVRIFSSDTTGQGIAVIQPRRPSLWSHVILENLAPPASNGWELTGGVTFYETEAKFSDCRFHTNRGEDALNLVRSRFELVNCEFFDSYADAIDIDFGKGTLTDVYFSQSGNDALDLSGAVVELLRIRIVGAGDKGISAGEHAYVTAKNIRIEASNIGVASKDLSEVMADQLDLRGCTFGMAAYRKKPEFGGGGITVVGLDTVGLKKPFVIEIGSSCTVNGTAIPAVEKGVRSTFN